MRRWPAPFPNGRSSSVTSASASAFPFTAGTIDLPLARSRKDPVRRAPDQRKGKASRTDYRIVESVRGISLVEFMPRTSNHQIRVHCSNRGFPILCDTLYGGGRERLQQVAPENRGFAAAVMGCFGRHALHARAITFEHPFLKNEITIEAPLPAGTSAPRCGCCVRGPAKAGE